MGISAADRYLEENPEVEKLVNGAPFIGDPFRQGRKKPDAAFRDILKEMKKNLRGNKIDSM